MRCPRCGGRSVPRTIPPELRAAAYGATTACALCIGKLRAWMQKAAENIRSVHRSDEDGVYRLDITERDGKVLRFSFSSDAARTEFLDQWLPASVEPDPEHVLCFLDSHHTKAV